MQIDFQRVLIEFNKDKPNWYGWKKPEDGEVLSNVKVVKDGATIPTQAEFDSKKQELEVQRDRRNGYGSIGDQLDMLYKDLVAGKVDATGEWAKAIKKVKDDNPKPS